jgi:phosphoenolpyruvate carboxylase
MFSKLTKDKIEFILKETVNIIDSFCPDIKDDFLKIRKTLENKKGSIEEFRSLTDGLSTDQTNNLIKIFYIYLMLLNIVEESVASQNQGVDLKSTIEDLEKDGFHRDDVIDVLKSTRYYPVFTAHPTESRRRTFLEAHHDISADFDKIFIYKDQDAIEHLRYRLVLLWKSDLIREEKIEVLFELDNLLYIVDSSILDTLTKVNDEITDIVGEFKEPIVRLGSWIGGDRDGNPYVTNKVMTKAMKIQHETIINRYIDEINRLIRELSISTNNQKISKELNKSLKREKDHLRATSKKLHQKEPFRAKLMLMKTKLKNRLLYVNSPSDIEFVYKKPSELIEDVDMMIESLDKISARGLKKLRNLVLIGGFHLFKLDFREHKDAIKYAIAEILSLLDYADSNFLEINEEEKLKVITEAIKAPKISLGVLMQDVSESTATIIEAFIKIAWSKDKISKNIIDSFILSMTEDASDVLSVLWFAKQSGLWEEGKKSKISITPLFETIGDLQKASTIMQTLIDNEVYKKYLDDRRMIQEIMIGYSDSSKDGGIFASNYNLNKAITNLIELGNDLGINFLLFHGRGGSVSRGGLPTDDAVMASPTKSVNGFLKVTEQGEVISSKFLNPRQAYSNFTQTLSALLKKSTLDRFGVSINCGKDDAFNNLMEQISEVSIKEYRRLVYETEGFIEYFKQATPIEFISRLNIGSRPSKRKATNRVEDLRAIPWVFSWTQNRAIIPAWYGVGSGLEAGADTKHGVEQLKSSYKECPFFKTTIDNIAMTLLKVDMDIAKMYSEFVEDSELRDTITNMIIDEYEKTKKYILLIRGEKKLLENEPMLRASILQREPYLKALSILQIELIKNYNSAKYEMQQDRIISQISSTIVGLSQGIRNTG